MKCSSSIKVPLGTVIDIPNLQSFSAAAAIIALAAGVALIRFKVNVVWVILGSGLLGIVLNYVRPE